MEVASDRGAVPELCANCGAALQGRWCHACGQEALRPEQRRLGWILRQWLGRMTSFDGKFPRSLVVLVGRPGRLGEEWAEGRRVRWSSPFSLFLVINLVYFLFARITDFSLPLEDMLRESSYAGWAQAAVEEHVPGTTAWAKEGGPVPDGLREFVQTYNRKSEGLSKTLIILHVPPTALAMMWLHLRRRRYFVDHFIHALHYWSALLLTLILVPAISVGVNRGLLRLGWVDSPDAGEGLWKAGLIAWLVTSLWLLLRRAHGESRLRAAWKAVLVFVACAATHLAYRGLLFAVTMSQM